ncbi:MAG: S-methyl-5-thioribose-phosphate isomerase [Pseudomonadota bacterium]
MTPANTTVPATLAWREDELYLLDQTRLPLDILIERQASAQQVWQSIQQLKVRGAPAIGVAAAYGLCVAMKPYREQALPEFRDQLQQQASYLESSRPTAVNLAWALRRMLTAAAQESAPDSAMLYARLVAEAQKIHTEDTAICTGIAQHGLHLIQTGMGVLTHCNAGALATTGLGTATAPMYLAHQRGTAFRVYADETRPLLQGARLTAWELDSAGIDVTLITDNMAASVMARGLVDLVIVGTDRVTANGDVVNKIGTLGVAILAKHFGIPFYVACPSSTIDLATPTGAQVKIEERAPEEVTGFGGTRTAPIGMRVGNPAFDVTPHELVTGLITERGIVHAPLNVGLQKVMQPAVNR